MAIFASASTGQFFDTDIDGQGPIPEDAVEIPQELYNDLVSGQINGASVDFSASPPSLVWPVAATVSPTIYASKSHMGFYRSDIHTHEQIPTDAVEISEELWKELITGQSNGKVIDFNVNPPVLMDPPPPTLEQITAAALAERASRIAEATVQIAPLQDAVDLGEATPEEEAALLKWKQYRVALNRLTTSAGWPTDIQWPVKPA